MAAKIFCYHASQSNNFDELLLPNELNCQNPALAHVKKIALFKVEKKNCEALKGWDIKIIPMNMENPNIALFFLISGWTIQRHKKKCPKTLFWTIFTPKTHLSLNRES